MKRVKLIILQVVLLSIILNAANLPTVNTLQDRLVEQVQRMIDAGHLAPGICNFNEHYCEDVTKNLAWELDDYWHNPADTVYTLAMAIPYLPVGMQQSAKDYLQSEFNFYPPHTYIHTGPSGEKRELNPLPPEYQASPAGPYVQSASAKTQTDTYWHVAWTFNPFNAYACWKYAEVMQLSQNESLNILNQIRSKIVAYPTDDSFLQTHPHVLNCYIAGYYGYLGLQDLAGETRSSQVEGWLNNALAKRVQILSYDPILLNGNEAGGFIFLVPELGEYLYQNAFTRVDEIITYQDWAAPYWHIVEAEEETRYAPAVRIGMEGVHSNIYETMSQFQARALILKWTREMLEKHLDSHCVYRGDLYYIQNLIYTIEAQGAVATKVLVSASPDIIEANGASQSIITAQVCDENGYLIATSNAEITFTLTGTGSLIGTNPVNATNGIAGITYQSGTSEETVTITATSSGLTQGSVNISLVVNDPPNAPTNLLCNGQINPVNFADLTPDLSWDFSDPDNGDTQSAYKILVADSQSNIDNNNGNMWDSTKIPSAAGNTATYEGSQLQANTMYYWKIMTWDNFDLAGSYSQYATFTTGNTDPRAFHGIPFQIPCKIETEDFDFGGEGVAYHDTTSGNQYGKYRTGESVDIMDNQSGGYLISANPVGEWLEYTVDVTQTGAYTIEVNVGATGLGGTFHIEFGSVDKTGILQVPDTSPSGCWNRQTISKTGVSLTQGRQIMRLAIDSNHSQWNDYSGCMDYVSVTLEGQVTPEITVTSPNGGETWTANAQAPVTWTSIGTIGNVNIDLSTDGGLNWISLAANSTNDGAETVTIPNSPSTACRIRVRDVDMTPSDMSNNNFTIEAGVSPPSISIDKTALDFGEIEIGNTGTLDFTITNTGGEVLTGSISTDKKWIEVDPTSFENNTVLVNVTVDNSVLNQTEGEFTGTISITSNGGNSSVEVTLEATCVLTKPNPYDPSKGNLTFFGDGIVPGQTTIKIYSLNGELIKELGTGDVEQSEIPRGEILLWRGTNEQGEEVANGIYIYMYESPKEKGVGKITIISR